MPLLPRWATKLLGAGQGSLAIAQRWVVVDCESSGLDPQRDALLSIGAVAVEGGKVRLEGAFSRVLRQPEPSAPQNIVVHGIGGESQMTGANPEGAMRDFAAFASDAPLVAFHAPFDRALLRRAVASTRVSLRGEWLDLAALAPALVLQESGRRKALDDWLAFFDISNPSRHDALADAFATAQLFQILLSIARRQGADTVGRVFAVAAGARWLGGAR